MKILILYAPVIHKGYINLFKQCRDVSQVFVIGPELIAEWDHIYRKDLRALEPEEICSMIRALDLFADVRVLSKAELSLINTRDDIEVVMPREEISVGIAEKYLHYKNVEFIDIFLRWHRDNSATKRPVSPDRSISLRALDYEMMYRAEEEAKKSFDCWIQVGAVATIKDEVVLVARNVHIPNEQSSCIVGDPRSNFKRGINIDITTAGHAEEKLICEAARRKDISLEGARLYTTTFPCPRCAHGIMLAGVSKLYYRDGYAVLDGEDTLKDAKIEIVHVEKSP